MEAVKALKPLKVSEEIHKELKVFIANNGEETMIDFVGKAIIKELKARGHTFTKKQKKPRYKNS